MYYCKSYNDMHTNSVYAVVICKIVVHTSSVVPLILVVPLVLVCCSDMHTSSATDMHAVICIIVY